MFHKHTRKVHFRRDEILTTALSTTLFSTGLPGLGLDVSAAMEDSARMKQILPMGVKDEHEVLLTNQKWKVNGKSVGQAVRLDL
jgi:hypothetical protein